MASNMYHNKANNSSVMERQVDMWLQQLGFRFNPFEALEAATDPNLHRYWIHHEAFEELWGSWPTMVFEPIGGGKTALRVQLAQTCYIGQESNRPFPISYLPSFLQIGHAYPSLDDHLRGILSSAAGQLLFSLVHRPHWFLRLAAKERQLLRALLDRHLPGPLDSFLSLINEDTRLDLLKQRFRFLPNIRIQPDAEQFLTLRNELRNTKSSRLPEALSERWQLFVDLLIQKLQVPSIYLLIDGLDAAPETADDPEALTLACAPLWQLSASWAEQNVFLKAFLPEEVKSTFLNTFTEQPAHVRFVSIIWTEALLTVMLRQRIDVATDGLHPQFDTIAEPGFIDVEGQITRATRPLPREVLALTQEILQSHVRRNGNTGRLSDQDLQDGLAAYRPSAIGS